MRTQVFSILFCVLALENVVTIITSAQKSYEYADYGPDEYPPVYEYDEIDPCKGGEWGVDEDFLGGKSKHDVFYDSNLTKIVDHPEWKMAKLCCDEHSYIFEDECSNREGDRSKHVCSVVEHEKSPPKKYIRSITCPQGCIEYRMADKEVSHLDK